MDSMTELNPPKSESFKDGPADDNGGEAKRAVVAGIIGAAVASVGYMIYSRLEDEQKDAIRRSVGKLVEDKMADIRSQLKL
jgi:hypothetical protein